MIPDLADLIGTWRTNRVIRHADGSVARFSGETTWRREDDHVRCMETGRLTQSGRSFEAERQTLWTESEAGLDIRFADGRPFHTLDGTGQAIHHCPPDIYRLRYDMSAWPKWSVHWRVTGPRKVYRAVTRYHRP
ncbi:MAG: DUF6314 family protein [Pseudomonadota bacterium]